MFKCSKKCTFSFLLYAHVCITNMVEFQKVMQAEFLTYYFLLVILLRRVKE